MLQKEKIYNYIDVISHRMDIITTLEKYKTLGDYFAPDYERDNDVLNEFKYSNAKLSEQHVKYLVDLLENSDDIYDKYFVADLLYLYDNFDVDLFEPLVRIAIYHKDPSFNRIFIRPCINTFGYTMVADKLISKYNNGSDSELEVIKRLLYWIRQEETNDSVEKFRSLFTD
jgi:hypothetical protein